MAFTTLNELFAHSISAHPRAAMFKTRKDGEWVPVSSDEIAEMVRETAAGLLVNGVQPGDRVALLSENRVEWAIIDLASLAVGAIMVPIYPTLLAEQVEYILGDCEPVMVFCSASDQVAKLERAQESVASLRQIVAFEAVDRANVLTLDRLREIGRTNLSTHAAEIDRRSASVTADSVATLIYTSGTTGHPKGVMLTHGNIAGNVSASLSVLGVHSGDSCLSFLPLSHILERMAGYYIMMAQGVTISFAQSVETVAADMIEVSPTVMISVPRLYEKIYARVLDSASQGSPMKRKIFSWAREVGEEWTRRKVAGEPIGPGLAIKQRIGDALVFKKLRARTGGNLRFFVSGGAPLSKEIAEFFYSAGLPILEGYGLTETSPVIAVNTTEHFLPGSVGPPIPGCDVKIADDGEILTRSPYVMKGYWKKDEATAETIIDGWLYTGDIGHIDDKGFLFITDRKKDIIVTAGGKNIAPQPVENDLKLSKFVGEAVLVGDRRRYLVALLVPNFEALETVATQNALDPNDRGALIAHPAVQKIFSELIHTANQRLASFEQIKYFKVLDHEFTLEDGQLTPSLKVKRNVVNKMYDEQISSMYTD